MVDEGTPAIVIEGLTRSFGSRHVLQGVDLVVPKGKTVVVLGLSGCGKSTLLKHIIGLLRPESGRIILDGKDIAHASSDEMQAIRWRFGMVFQNAALLASLTVGANVGLPLVERRELSHDEIRKRVAEKLALVGLAGAEERMPSELSGGMRKRAGLARAIVHEPEFLLYDEPTTGLDPIICRHVDDLIVRMREKLGVSSIVISHDIEGAKRTADVMVLLYEGRVIEQGPPDVFMNSTNPIVRQFLEGRSDGPIAVK